MKGLFHLRTARDLLAKLRHDFERLQQDHVNAYAAFDFFVTARHLPEWLYPGDSPEQKHKRRALFDDSVLMRLCRHIADGSKHFTVTAPQHDSVRDTSLQGSGFQPGPFQSDAFQVGQLIVELDGDAAVQFGRSIEVTDLAERILGSWKGHPDLAQTQEGERKAKQ